MAAEEENAATPLLQEGNLQEVRQLSGRRTHRRMNTNSYWTEKSAAENALGAGYCSKTLPSVTNFVSFFVSFFGHF